MMSLYNIRGIIHRNPHEVDMSTLYEIQADIYIHVWKSRFEGILEYGKLKRNSGYKIRIQGDTTQLDPPSILQGFWRWYTSQSSYNFLCFINAQCRRFMEELDTLLHYQEDCDRKNIEYSRVNQRVCRFALVFRNALLLCRNIYQNDEQIRQKLNEICSRIMAWVDKNSI